MNEVAELVISIVFIVAAGSVLHFAYGWSHEKKWVAFFAAVNESVWEHLKLAMVPSFVWMIYDLSAHGSNPNIWIATATAMITTIVAILILFYGYQIFIKRAILWLDIAIFILAIIVGRMVFYAVLDSGAAGMLWNYTGMIVVGLIFVAVALWTFWPPKTALFRDSRNGKYGLEGHQQSKHSHRHQK